MFDPIEKLKTGLSWNLGNQIFVQVFQLGISIIFARLITPEQFGTIVQATVILNFSTLILDCGLTSAMIQSQHISEDQKSTLFWFHFFLGFVLYLIILGSARMLEVFFENGEFANTLTLMSISLFFIPLGLIQRYLLMREVKFKQIFFVEINSILIAFIGSLFITKFGTPILAIISYTVFQNLSKNILYFFSSRWRPGLKFSLLVIREYADFSGWLFINRVFHNAIKNLDKIIISKILGPFDLGIYTKTVSQTQWPLENFSQVLVRLSFPIFSKIQEDKQRIKFIYLKISQLISYLLHPVFMIGFLFAKPLVEIVYGPNWLPMVPVLKILMVYGIIASIIAHSNTIYLSLAKTKLQFRVNLIQELIFVAVLFTSMSYGLIGIAYALVIAASMNLLINMRFPGLLINLSISEQFKNILQIFIIAICSALFTWCLKVIPNHMGESSMMFFGIASYFIFYIILSELSSLRIYIVIKLELFKILKKYKNPWRYLS